MRDNIAFLELKFGNIYGGYANFFAISDISLLVFDPSTNRICVESLSINADLDVVWVNSKVNELGHTIGRSKQVVNLRTRRKKPFKEDFTLDEFSLNRAFNQIRPTRRFIKSFFGKNFRKYNIRNIVTFDGKRDIFLCEKSGVIFRGMRVFDLQKALNKEFNYLFSLNKLGIATNTHYDQQDGNLKSNNLKYWIHPIAARQLKPRTAAWDAARMFMVYQEFNEYHDDFTMKSALLVNQIQRMKENEPKKEVVPEVKAETPKKEVVATETPKEEVAATETPKEEVVATETPKEEVAATETPKEEVAATETPKEEVAATETPKEEVAATEKVETTTEVITETAKNGVSTESEDVKVE